MSTKLPTEYWWEQHDGYQGGTGSCDIGVQGIAIRRIVTVSCGQAGWS